MTSFSSGWHPPLFLRIFGMMLASVALVQILNFAIFFLVPPPQPIVVTVDHIVNALKGAAAPGDKLRLTSQPIDNHDDMRPRELAVRALIAERLALPEAAVRVRWGMPGFDRPPPILAPGSALNPSRMGLPARPGFPPFDARGDLVLIGDFAVSARVGGRWHTIETVSRGMAPWRRNMLIWLVAAMVVVTPIAWLLARSFARPIALFASAARRLGRNPKTDPLPLAGPPEIRSAASAFNEMQARLNAYVEDRTTLVAAIAHDLRTPLMRLSLQLEQAPPAVQQACQEEVRDMEEMVSAVMSFVRDANQPSRRQRLDLRALAQSVTDGFIDTGAQVQLEPGDQLILDGDAPALKSLLTNLVGNAVRYAGDAHVALVSRGGMAIIEVTDNGAGMSPEDIDRAFDPFFRGERSRNRETGGIGLGLASVRGVARAHGGDAMLVNRPEGGLIAQVTLPL